MAGSLDSVASTSSRSFLAERLYAIISLLCKSCHNGVKQHGTHLMRPRGDVGDLLFEAVNVAHVCAPLSGLRFGLTPEAGHNLTMERKSSTQFSMQIWCIRGEDKKIPGRMVGDDEKRENGKCYGNTTWMEPGRLCGPGSGLTTI